MIEKKAQRGESLYTRSASDVHGFEVAGFDDAHSDGVGCRVVAQRHQQIPSTPLEKEIVERLLFHPLLLPFLLAHWDFSVLPLAACLLSDDLSASP